MKEVLEISPVPDAKGTILGEYNGKAIEQPDASQYGGDDNGYLAVFIAQINSSFQGRVLLPQRQSQSFLLLRGFRDIPG